MLDHEGFIYRLREHLSFPLPGEEAQFLMAPVSRERLKEAISMNLRPKKSAVLIALYPNNNSINTILIKRPTYEGVHSGQVAFPGGKFEESDGDLANTAMREAEEEIGLYSNRLEILGRLSDVYISPSNFLVSPYLAYLTNPPQLRQNSFEVEKIIHTDLFNLNSEKIRGIKSIEHSNGYKIKSPYYEVEGHTVWGATAMIISELNAIVKNVISF